LPISWKSFDKKAFSYYNSCAYWTLKNPKGLVKMPVSTYGVGTDPTWIGIFETIRYLPLVALTNANVDDYEYMFYKRFDLFREGFFIVKV
jgi:hypothetical protein